MAAVPHGSDGQGPTTITTEHPPPALQATAHKMDCGCCSQWWATTTSLTSLLQTWGVLFYFMSVLSILW
jgi:hypothetical protein